MPLTVYDGLDGHNTSVSVTRTVVTGYTLYWSLIPSGGLGTVSFPHTDSTLGLDDLTKCKWKDGRITHRRTSVLIHLSIQYLQYEESVNSKG